MTQTDKERAARFAHFKTKEEITAELRKIVEDCWQEAADKRASDVAIFNDILILNLTAFVSREGQHSFNAGRKLERFKK